MKTTIGDPYECECPVCGETIALDDWDPEQGDEIECDYCGCDIEVVSIEATYVVTLGAEEPEE